jgi:fluoride ion exporter CrcB/FEX
MIFLNILIVAICGGLGCLARFAFPSADKKPTKNSDKISSKKSDKNLAKKSAKSSAKKPISQKILAHRTLIINYLSLIILVIPAALSQAAIIQNDQLTIAFTAFAGGFSTLSTVHLEILNLLKTKSVKNVWKTFGYIFALFILPIFLYLLIIVLINII